MTRWMLGWILDGSCADFRWILGPTWPPKPSQNQPQKPSKNHLKSNPTSILSSITFLIELLLICCWFFGAKSLHKSSKTQLKNHPNNITSKYVKSTKSAIRFTLLRVRSSQDRLKIYGKSIRNRSKKWSMTRWMLGWILEGSWIDFWCILASKLEGKMEPSWHENLIKWDTKTMSKNQQKI